MEIKRFTVGPFLEHTYVLSDPESYHAYVIDPGGWNEQALSYVKEKRLQMRAIFSTHGHIDHIAGAYDLRKKTNTPYRLHQKDAFLLEDLDAIAAYFGFPKITKPVVDAGFQEGDTFDLGKEKIRVIETPGHTPGGVCFMIKDVVFVGDTLFRGSIGRTDLPGGNHEQLLRSIKTKLMILDDTTIVHCGHGPQTTIGHERKTNPFLLGQTTSFF